MKALLALTAFALILTAACSTGDAATTTCAKLNEPTRPTISPIATPPEGTLLLARELPKSVFILNSECGETTAIPNADQTWPAPNGSKATVILNTGGLAVIDGDGIHAVAEWDPNAGFWPTVAWSTDSKLLAYSRPATNESAGVWAWNGRESRRVYTGANAWPIGFTNDGDVVLGLSMKRLKLADSNGKELQSIDIPFDDFSTGYVVSPDGRKLAVMSEGDGDGHGSKSTGLWLYDFGSHEWAQLVELNAGVSSSPGAGLFVSSNALVAAMARKGTPAPTWSADGQRLTYYSVDTGADQVYHMELWLHDFRTGENQYLSEGAWSDGWSRDGRYLAFQRSDPEAIGLVGPDGAVEVLDQDEGFAGNFAWAPDGGLLVSSGHDLKLYDPEARATTTLEHDGKPIGGVAAYPGSVHASPSGRYFAMATSYDSGGGYGFAYGNISPGVYIVDTKTGEVTRIIDKAGVYVSGWLGE